jgi:hypothetical protein
MIEQCDNLRDCGLATILAQLERSSRLRRQFILE